MHIPNLVINKCWGLTTRQPLWVILCRLQEKGRKQIEEMEEEMKKWERKETGTGIEVKKQKKKEHSPSTLTCYKDSRPCPTPAVASTSWTPRNKII